MRVHYRGVSQKRRTPPCCAFVQDFLIRNPGQIYLDFFFIQESVYDTTQHDIFVLKLSLGSMFKSFDFWGRCNFSSFDKIKLDRIGKCLQIIELWGHKRVAYKVYFRAMLFE